jgi:hypothetical protein
MSLDKQNTVIPKVDTLVEALASAGGVAKAPQVDAAHGPTRGRLEQLAAIWARQTGRTIVVA